MRIKTAANINVKKKFMKTVIGDAVAHLCATASPITVFINLVFFIYNIYTAAYSLYHLKIPFF